MCGIVGYVGNGPCRELLLSGLAKLEYRGYDSAGLSILADDRIESVRAVGNLAALRSAVAELVPAGAPNAAATTGTDQPATGIAHTRWATHGRVTEANAHPHFDNSDRIHIALNGIIENHVALRRELQLDGADFTSETDAEVVAHLISAHYDGDLVEAVVAARRRLSGHYAFVAVSADEPGLVVGSRSECPLTVGLGDGETFLASAIPAFIERTTTVRHVGDDQIVAIRPDGAEAFDADGKPVVLDELEIDWDEGAAELEGFETFMAKEIHEQADAVASALVGRVRGSYVDLDEIGISDERLRGLERIVIVGCGTSYHAGLVGRYAIEEWAGVPVDIDIASEFRYRRPLVGPGDLMIGMTQSGETADTLAAMRLARERGATVLALTNVMGSQATRDSDAVMFTRAGIEISVAATKTFVAQVACMYLIALKLAAVRGALPPERCAELTAQLAELPAMIEHVVETVDEPIRKLAADWHPAGFFLYLGRHIGLPVALEGALKLKEISYTATDAYAAGEMKHGPIALLDEQTPVVAVATDAPVLDKLLSNVAEVRARGAHVIAVTTEGSDAAVGQVDDAIAVPRTDWIIQAILAVVPLQMLAYRIARERGLTVDQPRNLAKTVTVE